MSAFGRLSARLRLPNVLGVLSQWYCVVGQNNKRGQVVTDEWKINVNYSILYYGKKSFFGLSEFVKDTQTFTDLEFREAWKMDKILKIWKNFKG